MPFPPSEFLLPHATRPAAEGKQHALISTPTWWGAGRRRKCNLKRGKTEKKVGSKVFLPPKNRMLKFYIINNFNLYTLSYFCYIKSLSHPFRGFIAWYRLACQSNLTRKIAIHLRSSFCRPFSHDGRLFSANSHKTNDNFFPPSVGLASFYGWSDVEVFGGNMKNLLDTN